MRRRRGPGGTRRRESDRTGAAYRGPRPSRRPPSAGRSPDETRRRVGRLGRFAGCALVAFGASLPPLAGLAALTAVALRDGLVRTAAAEGSGGLAAQIGSADPAAFPLWIVGREWLVVAAAVLAFGWWAVCAATAARVLVRTAALRS